MVWSACPSTCLCRDMQGLSARPSTCLCRDNEAKQLDATVLYRALLGMGDKIYVDVRPVFEVSSIYYTACARRINVHTYATETMAAQP